MSDGITLNNVYVSRLHRCNAQNQLDDARDMIKLDRDRLLVLAAMAPMNVDEGDGPMPWDFYVRREVNILVEDLLEMARQEWQAEHVVLNPEDVRDDYDEEPTKGPSELHILT